MTGIGREIIPWRSASEVVVIRLRRRHGTGRPGAPQDRVSWASEKPMFDP